MIKQEQRAVATWQEAVNMLASNGNTMVDAFNDLEKKVNRKSRVAGFGFLCLGVALFVLKCSTQMTGSNTYDGLLYGFNPRWYTWGYRSLS